MRVHIVCVTYYNIYLFIHVIYSVYINMKKKHSYSSGSVDFSIERMGESWVGCIVVRLFFLFVDSSTYFIDFIFLNVY